MKKIFFASLCYCGLRGGAIYMDNEYIIYRNQTLTIPKEYKKIVMPRKEITEIRNGCLLIFPTVELFLKNQRSYKFVIFNRRRFFKSLNKVI